MSGNDIEVRHKAHDDRQLQPPAGMKKDHAPVASRNMIHYGRRKAVIPTKK
jgi:hypothetical protein